MITPRETLLLRAPTLAAFQRAIAARVVDARLRLEEGEPVVLVPTRAAADQLRSTLEDLGAGGRAGVRSLAIVPRGEWYDWLQARAASPVRLLTQVEREVLADRAARDAVAAGALPPFRLRPGIVAELLAFYDDLRRRQKTVDAFERLLVEDLEPNADIDRGARRLLEQTRFLVAAFRAYEHRLDAAPGTDEHRLRDHLRETGMREPVSEVLVTVPDEAANPAGLYPADFDLLARLPGLTRVTIVATDALLDTGFRQRLDDVLPEIGVTRVVPDPAPSPRLVVPADTMGESVYFACRDREEELRSAAGAIRDARAGAPGLSAAVVVARPLPYLYLAPAIFADAGLRTRAGVGLPLAVDPYAAAVHLVLEYAAGDRSATTMALFENPHFAFAGDDGPRAADLELAPLLESRSLADHLATLRGFLQRHAAPLPDRRDAIAERAARARALIHDGLEALETAHRALDGGGSGVSLADLATRVRRWVESRTYPPGRSATRDGDVHLIDPDAAPYGRFDDLFIAGLVEAEWPRRTERNIFYPAGMLASLGWPVERDRLRAARALFNDLLHLPRDRVRLSAFVLEDDAAVTVSPMLEDLDPGVLDRVAAPAAQQDGLAVRGEADSAAERWLALRRGRAECGTARDRLRGDIGPQPPGPYAVGALERYLDCPFKYFARHVLGLKAEDDGEQTMTVEARGLFLHRVFEEFFRAWGAEGRGAITPDTLDDALARFAGVAETRLATLPPAERAVARAWLLGSPASPGLAERIFGREAENPVSDIVERLLEYPIDGEVELGALPNRRTVSLRGRPDRIDLHADGTLVVIDYKTGRAPERSRGLQLPLYARCAEQRLRDYRGRDWQAVDGLYVAFGEPRVTVPMGGRGSASDAMDEGEARAVDAIAGIEAGQCPPRPADLYRCTLCPYQTVCRKDYVEDV